jgi:hypothetical protein
MSFKPDPEKHYRIQNIDSEAYLEARDVESGSKVTMGPRKKDDKQLVIGYMC